jgi:hypothetical protein
VSGIGTLAFLWLLSRSGGGGLFSNNKPTQPQWPTPASPPPMAPQMPAFASQPPAPTREPSADTGTPLAELAQPHSETPPPASANEPAIVKAKAAAKAKPKAKPKATKPTAASRAARAAKTRVPAALKAKSATTKAAAQQTASVSDLQSIMISRGAKLKRDGLYGPKTANAWSTLARSKSLPPTISRVGPKIARVVSQTYDTLKTPPIP